jgi:hypothetical protein
VRLEHRAEVAPFVSAVVERPALGVRGERQLIGAQQARVGDAERAADPQSMRAGMLTSTSAV